MWWGSKKSFEWIGIVHTTYKRLLDACEYVLGKKLKGLDAYIRKEEKFQIYDSSFYFKKPLKEQMKPKWAKNH